MQNVHKMLKESLQVTKDCVQLTLLCHVGVQTRYTLGTSSEHHLRGEFILPIPNILLV